MDAQIRTLIDLQAFDTRIAALESDAARLPRDIAAIDAGLDAARKEVEGFRVRLDRAKKDLRAKEKDLEVTSGKRSKAESRLWEVKTNKEYSAVLLEIEEIKQEKAKTEEEILAFMEMQESLAGEVREAEARLRVREEQARKEQAVVREKLAAVEAELETVRAERETLARELPRPLLTEYDRIARARGRLGIVSVTVAAICGGCRVSIRPQAIQELRSGTALMTCESCGRFLYWQDPA